MVQILNYTESVGIKTVFDFITIVMLILELKVLLIAFSAHIVIIVTQASEIDRHKY